jgi:hypothetical protein
MKSDSKNFYSLIPNYSALREEEKKYKKKPDKEEIQDFIKMWNELYKFWREKHPNILNHLKLEHKIKVRKELNKIPLLH